MPDQDNIRIRREDLQLLAKMDQKLSDLCNRVGKMENAVIKQTDTCNGRLEHCQDVFEGKANNKLLQWVLGIMCTVMIIMGGSVMYNRTVLTELRANGLELTQHLTDLRNDFDRHEDLFIELRPRSGWITAQDPEDDIDADDSN